MDYDNDGILDFISGSYDPGDVYLCRGLGDGKYAKVESILDEDGQPLVHHPVEFAKYMEMKDDAPSDGDDAIQMRVASFGSWPAPVDWDADGDLDMLIGSFGGALYLRTNVGTREEPKYAQESIAVAANGTPLKVKSHANPVVTDWDGDGKWDLVIGSGDGSVGWYQNIGTASQPEFGSQNLLVKPAAEIKFLEQNLKPGEDPIPGVRAQICVTDFNGDGLQDLLVGDYSEINLTRQLSKQEQTEFDDVKQQLREVGESVSKLQTIIYGQEIDEELKKEKEAEYQELINQLQTLDKKQKSFYAESRSASFVWLYLRKKTTQPQTFVRSVTGKPSQDSAPQTSTSRPAEENSAVDSGPVAINVNLQPGETETLYTLSVTFDVQPNWHLYASVPADSGYRTAEVELNLPEGVSATGEWQKPAGQLSSEIPDTWVYEGSVTFSHEIEIASDELVDKIGLKIEYQVCNESLCLPPKTVHKSVNLPSQ